ncbi:MAG: hypothetical protein NDI73_06005 [Desulfuromonadales bacterium]|nr:hypothetical protein [Desulfuromonadales bacterium]
MASGEEISRQIGALAEELGHALAGAQDRIEALTAELVEARAGGADILAAKQVELETAEKRIESLVQKLKEARQEAADARDEVRKELQQQLETLEKAAANARDEFEQERSIRKRLEKGAATDERRLNELEKALAEGKPGGDSSGTGKDAGGAEFAKLQAALNEALAAIKEERQAKVGLEDELGEAHKLIEALEKALKDSREHSRGSGREVTEEDGRRVQALAEKLASAEAQLEEERCEGRKYAKACADAEKRLAELEQALSAGSETRGQPGLYGGGTAAASKLSTEKPLPHELRPSPKPGTLFRPDWELAALPCKSADQVLQAWGSAFNVQLSLEGYPAQYCTAFLVVLKQGKQKQLYMVFNLKSNKHVLVCVPSKPPGDEAALNKLIGEGQKYLQMSGFELEKIPQVDMTRVLEGYFLQK